MCGGTGKREVAEWEDFNDHVRVAKPGNECNVGRYKKQGMVEAGSYGEMKRYGCGWHSFIKKKRTGWHAEVVPTKQTCTCCAE